MTDDVSQWWVMLDASDNPHVVPKLGPEHDCFSACWCKPKLDDEVMIHNLPTAH